MTTGKNKSSSRKTTYQSSATASLVEPVPEVELTANVDTGQITSLQSRKTDVIFSIQTKKYYTFQRFRYFRPD